MISSGKATLHAKSAHGDGDLTITVKTLEIVGPKTIIAGEPFMYYVSSNSNDFAWCLNHDSIYDPYIDYGKEISLSVSTPGSYVLEANHVEAGTSVQIQITVVKNPALTYEDEEDGY